MCTKKTLTDDEKRKLCNQDFKQTRKAGRKPQPRYLFANTRPQSETHVQVLRAEPVIPSVSLLPPNGNSNKERFQICMLVLFKPFVDFQDLYNGISWEDSFENTDFGEHLQYIRNVQEMHLGLQEKQNKLNDDGTGGKNGDDDDDDMDHEEVVMDDEIDDSNALLQETLIDSATSLALEVIKNSDCLTNIPCRCHQLIILLQLSCSNSNGRVTFNNKRRKTKKNVYFGGSNEEHNALYH